MRNAYYFGYGSLVNIATLPTGTQWQRASLRGWRRCWGHPIEGGTGLRWAAMDVRPDPAASIDGVVLRGGGAMDDYLARREAGYRARAIERSALSLARPLPDGARAQLWCSAAGAGAALHRLRSYSDVIAAGFLQLYGEDGLMRYRDSTDGWALPLHDDSDAPLYPRAVAVSPAQRRLFDTLGL